MKSEQKCASRRVKQAYAKRNASKTKNADGKVVSSTSTGLGLKDWAKQQIAEKGLHAVDCEKWFEGKKQAG